MGAAEERDRQGNQVTQDFAPLLRRTIESELLNLLALDSGQLSVHPNGPTSWSAKRSSGA